MSVAYRGLEYAAARGWSELTEALDASRASLVYERRAGRALGGLVGVVAGTGLFAAALLTTEPSASGSRALLPALLGGGAAAAVAYLVGRSAARFHLACAMGSRLRRSSDPVVDVANLESSAPARFLQRLAGRLEYASILLPMLAISLLAPLTLHAMVAAALMDLSSFDGWIRTSALIVGHAHLVLCICSARYAAVIRKGTAAELMARGERDWLRALAFTTAAAAIPGMIFMGVPPMLTLVTGLVFIPVMFKTMRGRVVSEREGLAMLG